MLPREILLNASYEAYINPDLKKSVLKIHDGFISLYEKIKVQDKEARRLVARNFTSDTDNMVRIIQVFIASQQNEETKTALQSAIEEAYLHDIKPYKSYEDSSYIVNTVIRPLYANIAKVYNSFIGQLDAQGKYLSLLSDAGSRIIYGYKDTNKVRDTILNYKPNWDKYSVYLERITSALTDKNCLRVLAETSRNFSSDFPYLTGKIDPLPSNNIKDISFETSITFVDKKDFHDGLSRRMGCMPVNSALVESLDRFLTEAEGVQITSQEDTIVKISNIIRTAYVRVFSSLYGKGIDVHFIMTSYPITPKEIRLTLNELLLKFQCLDKRFPSTVLDVIHLTETILSTLFATQLARVSNNLTFENKQKQRNTKVIDAANKKRLDQALCENQRLTAEIKKTEESKVLALKSLKDENTELRNEVRTLQKLVESLTAPDENNEEDIPVDSEDYVQEEEIDLKAFTEENKILCWGAKENMIARLEEEFPSIEFMDSEMTNVASKMLTKYDGIIICINNTGHTKYYAFKSAVKLSGVPFYHLGKSDTSISGVEQGLLYLKRKLEGKFALDFSKDK